MTPSEMNIFKSLIAVAWADGNLGAPEQSMLEGLFWAFEASEAEERQLKEFAELKRTLEEAIERGELEPRREDAYYLEWLRQRSKPPE